MTEDGPKENLCPQCSKPFWQPPGSPRRVCAEWVFVATIAVCVSMCLAGAILLGYRAGYLSFVAVAWSPLAVALVGFVVSRFVRRTLAVRQRRRQ